MTVLITVLFTTLVIVSFSAQKDIFSPAKFYLVFLTVYLFDVFLSDQKGYVYLAYILYLAIGYIFVILDKNTNDFGAKSEVPLYVLKKRRVQIIIWSFTFIAALAQLGLILHFGGLTEYLNSIRGRVLEWQGLGYLLVFKQVAPLANIIYLIVGLKFKIRDRSWWILYAVNTLLVVVLGLMSGSRGATLMGLVHILIAWHYFAAPVSKRFVFSSVIILLVAAAALGGMRNYQISDDGFSAASLFEKVNFAEVKIFRYGIIPLEMLIETQEPFELGYGSTFLSALTRFVPRSIFPNKPKTGGEVLTQHSHGDDYSGTVNYSPGLLVESILNFGYAVGPAFFVLMMMLIMVALINIRRRFLHRRRAGAISSIKYFYLYLTFLYIPGGLLFAEWANLIASAVINITFFIAIYSAVSVGILSGHSQELHY